MTEIERLKQIIADQRQEIEAFRGQVRFLSTTLAEYRRDVRKDTNTIAEDLRHLIDTFLTEYKAGRRKGAVSFNKLRNSKKEEREKFIEQYIRENHKALALNTSEQARRIQKKLPSELSCNPRTIEDYLRKRKK